MKKHSALALALTLTAFSAVASRIVPADPSAFDPVNLRMTVDSCTFVPGTEDRAVFTYTVNGVTSSKTISRMTF